MRCFGWYVEGFAQRTKISVDPGIDSRLNRFSREVELARFRLIQESLINVYRHWRSPTARVRLASESGINICPNSLDQKPAKEVAGWSLCAVAKSEASCRSSFFV